MSSTLLPVARAIVSQPTAPFHEDAVCAEITKQLGECRHVTLEPDSFGNLLACYRRGSMPARYLFVAHMDHPGFVGGAFLGGVPAAYREKNAPTRDFGPFAMWDLPAFDVRDGRIYSRACDDLVGCAAIVEMFYELERSNAQCTVYGLFTRAEEVGFIGAIHFAKAASLDADVTVVSLETSSERGGPVKMGAGVIVRVGDKSSIFDSGATALLTQIAQQRNIPFQRSLMSGGTCEATAFQLYGLRSAGLCVALGNYHNCGPGTQIAAEYVSVNDVAAMTDLCVAAATFPAEPGSTESALRARLEKDLAENKKYFRALQV